MAAMTDIERADHKLERRLNQTQYILFALLIIVILVPVVGGWWAARTLPIVSTIKIENLQIVGESELCHGEPLVVSYDFHAAGAGVLVRDASVWSMKPPRTIVFSASRRFILDGPIEQHLTETWHVPSRYLDPEMDAWTPLLPGKYRRYMAISSPSRSTVIAIGGVNFTIRDDCN